jgi:NRPS condensation-like uncharacterized protein
MTPSPGLSQERRDNITHDTGAIFMKNVQNQVFRRTIIGERIMLKLPFNVVLTARIKGEIGPSEIPAAFQRLRSRHPLLAVRVAEDNGTAAFVTENVPANETFVMARNSDTQWLNRVKEEFRIPFSLETGPLVRCSVIHSKDISDIILCGHHAICDGMSLGYLLRDILHQLTDSENNPVEPLVPPPIDRSNIPQPPATPWVQKFILDKVNKKWEEKNIRFSKEDVHQMHEKFWEQNREMQLLAWQMEKDDTAKLVKCCREKGVTVNSALWAAFLAAQYEVQKDRHSYHQNAALAVNTRDKLLQTAGEAFGFYASSLSVKLPYSPKQPFWGNARVIHSKIAKELKKTNLFRMLISELIHPGLLDSIYFQKYGMADNGISKKFLRKMNWDKTSYGYAITNVGRFDIPTQYGPLKIESVHGPLFYSDVEEKMVGVITVGGKLSFLMACRKSAALDINKLKACVMKHLEEAVV